MQLQQHALGVVQTGLIVIGESSLQEWASRAPQNVDLVCPQRNMRFIKVRARESDQGLQVQLHIVPPAHNKWVYELILTAAAADDLVTDCFRRLPVPVDVSKPSIAGPVQAGHSPPVRLLAEEVGIVARPRSWIKGLSYLVRGIHGRSVVDVRALMHQISPVVWGVLWRPRSYGTTSPPQQAPTRRSCRLEPKSSTRSVPRPRRGPSLLWWLRARGQLPTVLSSPREQEILAGPDRASELAEGPPRSRRRPSCPARHEGTG